MTASMHDLKGTARKALKRYHRVVFRTPRPLSAKNRELAAQYRTAVHERRVAILHALGITDENDVNRCLQAPWLESHTSTLAFMLRQAPHPCFPASKALVRIGSRIAAITGEKRS